MNTNLLLFDESRTSGEKITIKLAQKDLSINFVWCPKGTFKLGYSNETKFENSKFTPNVVLTKGFWIATKPLTRYLVDAISDHKFGIGTLHEQSDKSPISQITWSEANQICNLLTANVSQISCSENVLQENIPYKFSLPTESQWEYACKADTDTKWFFGNNEEQLDDYAWYNDITGQLPDVGLKKPNPWGIHDLYGLVYEWCCDHQLSYHLWNNFRDPVINDHHPKIQERNTRLSYSIRVVRGGCIYFQASECTSISSQGLPDYNEQNDLTGIRPVLVQV